MALIHFIWWGPRHPDGKSTDTPMRFAEILGDEHQVILWCKGEHKTDFEHYFSKAPGSSKTSGRKPTVQAADGLKETFVGRVDPDLQEWYRQAFQIIETLDELRAFSAVKDLLEFMILHLYGGFYFDTTCMVTDQARLKGAIEADYTKISVLVPKVGGKVTHQPLLQTARAIMFISDRSFLDPDELEDDPELFVPIDLVDVWAFYAPEKSKTVEYTLKSYVSRCNRMGLYPGGTSNFLKKEGEEPVEGQEVLQGNFRNDLIGNLPVKSLDDGLLCFHKEDDGPPPSECMWDVDPEKEVQIEESKEESSEAHEKKGIKARRVPALGIMKVYANTWRAVKIEK